MDTGGVQLTEDNVEYLVHFLSIQDVLNCSRVKISWRSSFNKNIIWKKLCRRKGYEDHADFLSSKKSVVKPNFKEPKLPSVNLEPCCEWKVKYMRVLHHLHNLKIGRYEINRLVTDCLLFETGLPGSQLGDFIIFYKSKLDSEYQVWDFRGKTLRRSTLSVVLSSKETRRIVRFINDKLIIIEDALLQVYELLDNQFKLLYRRLIHGAEHDMENIPETVPLEEWYKNIVKHNLSFQYSIHHEYFTALSLHDFGLHIWNLKSAQKVGGASIPLSNYWIFSYFAKIWKDRKLDGLLLSFYVGDLTPKLTMVYFYSIQTGHLTLHDEINGAQLLWILDNGVGFVENRYQQCIRFRNIFTKQDLAEFTYDGFIHKCVHSERENLVFCYIPHQVLRVKVVDRQTVVQLDTLFLKNDSTRPIYGHCLDKFLMFSTWTSNAITIQSMKDHSNVIDLPYREYGHFSEVDFYFTRLITVKHSLNHDCHRVTVNLINFW